jgi:hypothetical protein
VEQVDNDVNDDLRDIRHLEPLAFNQQAMDYFHRYRNAVSRNKPIALAATAAALGVGYAYYSSRMANIPLATKVPKISL